MAWFVNTDDDGNASVYPGATEVANGGSIRIATDKTTQPQVAILLEEQQPAVVLKMAERFVMILVQTVLEISYMVIITVFVMMVDLMILQHC